MNTATTKALRNMIRIQSPDYQAWLVAADLIEEAGGMEGYDAADLRQRARLSMAIGDALAVAATVWPNSRRTPQTHEAEIGDGLTIRVGCGNTILMVYVLKGTRRVSCVLNFQRRRVTAGDASYIARKVRELVGSIDRTAT